MPQHSWPRGCRIPAESIWRAIKANDFQILSFSYINFKCIFDFLFYEALLESFSSRFSQMQPEEKLICVTGFAVCCFFSCPFSLSPGKCRRRIDTCDCFHRRFLTALACVALEAIKSQDFRPVVLKHKDLGENPKRLHRTRQSVKTAMASEAGKSLLCSLSWKSADFCPS